MCSELFYNNYLSDYIVLKNHHTPLFFIMNYTPKFTKIMLGQIKDLCI